MFLQNRFTILPNWSHSSDISRAHKSSSNISANNSVSTSGASKQSSISDVPYIEDSETDWTT